MDNQPKTVVLHVALNPVTGPWSVMRDLALAQSKSGLYRAVAMGIVHSRAWPAIYDTELSNLGLPYFKAQTAESFGTAQFVWQWWQKPGIGNWVRDLAGQGNSANVIVHFHNAWMSGVFQPLHPEPALPVRCVATFHGVNAQLEGRPLRRWLHRWMAARLPRFGVRLTSVDVSNLVRAEQILGLNRSLFTIVPNGVVDDPASVGARWDGQNDFMVGHVGSITERKGWRLVADAVSRLRADGLRIRLLIAGTGPEDRQASQAAQASGGAIEFLGHVSHPRKNLLPRLHALAIMSQHEGLPMTLIEAMAAGLPVVATAVGGIPEAVTDGTSGMLIPRTVEKLVDSLRQLHASPKLWSTLSDGARKRFVEQFEISKVVSAYHAVYSLKG